jgi:ABC-type lipoprotein release transport system permease subunit
VLFRSLIADDREGVLIGQLLADKLGLKTGDPIHLVVNTSNGDMDEQTFTVRGTYSTHTPGYDKTTVFLPLAKAQTITRAENHASTIFVLLNSREDADLVAAAIPDGQYQVKTWKQLNELLIQTEELYGGYMVLLYLIVLGITATVIVNTLIMAVFERTREIGILSAIGMKSGRIMAMFFAESSLLAVGGIVMGLVLGALIVGYLTVYGIPLGDYGVSNGMLLGENIYASLTVNDAVGLTTAAFIITLLAGVYPAVLAARMEPVQALRGGK